MMTTIVPVAIFVIATVTVFLVGRALLRGSKDRTTVLESDAVTPRHDRGRKSRFGWLKQFLAMILPQLASEKETISQDLRRAGQYQPHALRDFLAVRNAVVIATAAITGFAVSGFQGNPAMVRTVVVLGVLVAIGCYSVPRMHLRFLASGRVSRIQQGLPDALDLVTMCLTGGLSLQDSLSRVGRELGLSHPDVAMEFDIIQRQADAGTISQALKQFAQRIDIPDIKSLAAIVSQTERLGTNVSKAVKDYADGVRTMSRQRAEEHASKVTIKMLFPIVFCLTPPIYMILCGPPILELKDFVTEQNQPGGVLAPSIQQIQTTGTQSAGPNILSQR